jgi:hypothetical protein
MSGEESLAQVNREIAYPKLKNLQRAGFVIFIYSMLFTSLVSFFAVMIIPDAERAKYLDNLIGGLSMFLVGPFLLRLVFHGFVVLVGTLILSGAVNTAIIGSNGVLTRVAEDGVMPDWFRHPHSRFGTSSRIINLIVILQIVTIVLTRGNLFILGEAYAFGVVWSFAMNALSVLVLRFKLPGAPEWKVPLNFHIGKTEIPVGLGLIAIALFTLALINCLTKKVATISGIAIDVIVRYTEGYPYFLQEYGKVVWDLAPENLPIGRGIAEEARRVVEAKLDESFFRVRVERTTELELRYLRAMAEPTSGLAFVRTRLKSRWMRARPSWVSASKRSTITGVVLEPRASPKPSGYSTRRPSMRTMSVAPGNCAVAPSLATSA